MLTGPDVSHYQGEVNMQAVRGAGHTFVGIKCTDGGSYLDPQFARNRQHARDAGLIRLLYHFGRPSSVGTQADAIAEADWFCDHLGRLEAGEISVLDIEDPAVGGSTDLGPWALAFLAHVDERTGRAGGSPDDDAELYTYGPYATAHLRLSSKLADRHLWFAAYTPTPRTPSPWSGWTFWQHTSNGSCPGIAGRCDLNKFTGPLEALQHIAGLQEDDMYSDTDRARDNLMAEQVQQIHDALYKGDVKFGVFPGMEGMTRDIYKKIVVG